MSRSPAISGQVTKPQDQLISQFKAAIRCGTPLIGITTSDQFALIKRVASKINGDRKFIEWDCARGFAPVNCATTAATQASAQVVAKICGNNAGEYLLLPDAAKVAANAPTDTILFIHNAQRHLDDPQAVQAVSNLRDVFKANGCAIVLVGPQLKLPAELAGDVVVIDEPLPNAEQLAEIIREVHLQSDIEALPENVARAVEAVQGLSAFAAEQVTAMSVEVDEVAKKITGVNLDALWERKRKQVEQTPGLAVSREGVGFKDLGGLANVKGYLTELINGNGRPNAVVMIEEIEKMLGGASGDSSGVSQDQLGTLLGYMQDNNSMGVILVGHPGSGKSAVAKAVGNQAGVPTIKLDLGAAKGSLVGQSEQQLREALKVITAVSNGSTLWVATSNGIQNVPPEMRARFKTGGPFFFDLPVPEEREAIWKVHRAKHKIKASDQQPNDEGWVGREIEQCCELAWRLNKPLSHAAQYIVPISRSSPDKIEVLRKMANNSWLSASHSGIYRMDGDATPLAVAAAAGQRKMRVD